MVAFGRNIINPIKLVKVGRFLHSTELINVKFLCHCWAIGTKKRHLIALNDIIQDELPSTFKTIDDTHEITVRIGLFKLFPSQDRVATPVTRQFRTMDAGSVSP